MATAILPSQNPQRHRFRHETLAQPRSATNSSSNLDRCSYAATGNRRRKRSPARFRSGDGRARSHSTLVESRAAKKNLVMGQVKILKRGETLSSFQNKERGGDRENTRRLRPAMIMVSGVSGDFDLLLGTTDRLGPDPETVQKQIGACKGMVIVGGGYAGAGCSVSPPPSSLPIPGFLGKSKRIG